MIHQKKNIKYLVAFLNFYTYSRRILKRNQTLLITTIVSVICTLPILTAIPFAYLVYEETHIADFWVLRHQIKNKVYRRAVNVLGGYVHQTVCSEHPLLLCLSMCILLHSYGLLLKQCNENLYNINFSPSSIKCAEIFNDFCAIEVKTRLLKSTLSVPLFVSLFSSFSSLFFALATNLKANAEPTFSLELGINALIGIIVLFSLTVCSSRIPEYMTKIKTTARSLINKYQLRNMDAGKEIDYLLRMEKTDAVYLCACGMVDFKRSLLLSSFGTLFTYGVLIMNT
ncbi:uncharacterized protein NPIL_493281 [Nephila pilipes]|uniref:Uncharacterized protein n=1 Tax=Nephila pilipes TaxID=299642 RepID=A0A8X6URG8_NEPPI|nr:uncharacterized protein NPIL_493281 [Nephila pilipes]